MKILAISEQRDNKLKKSAFEVVRTARTIADQTQGEVIALVIGNQVQAIAGELGGYGATKVLVVQHPKLEKYSSTAYTKIIAEAAKKETQVTYGWMILRLGHRNEEESKRQPQSSNPSDHCRSPPEDVHSWSVTGFLFDAG